MKKYVAPQAEVLLFSAQDIVTASNPADVVVNVNMDESDPLSWYKYFNGTK